MTGAGQRMASGLSWLERPGPGPALVFLHGIGSSAESFRGLFDLLPERFRLLAWNAPGYGASDRLEAEWPLDRDYAAAFGRLLDAAGIDRAILLGHSLGTLIASAFARARPDRVAHLVLASSACGYRIALGDKLPGGAAARIEDLERLGPVEFARARAARLVFEPQANAAIVAKVEHEMARIEPRGYVQAVRMLASGDLEATLKDMRAPCDFIIGAEDIVTPEAQTLRAAQALKEGGGEPGRIERIEAAGHAVYLQKPEAFAEALLRLVAPQPQANKTPGAARIGGQHG